MTWQQLIRGHRYTKFGDKRFPSRLVQSLYLVRRIEEEREKDELSIIGRRKWPLGGLENQMAAERSKEANSGTFGWPNSPESVDRIGQNVSTAAPSFGLTFPFRFQDEYRPSRLVFYAFLSLRMLFSNILSRDELLKVYFILFKSLFHIFKLGLYVICVLGFVSYLKAIFCCSRKTLSYFCQFYHNFLIFSNYFLKFKVIIGYFLLNWTCFIEIYIFYAYSLCHLCLYG